jgi:hypothetical protein
MRFSPKPLLQASLHPDESPLVSRKDADKFGPAKQHMNTFEEFQRLATEVPLSLRNNLDRINLPIVGLQEEAGRIGSLLAAASASGRFSLTAEQRSELQRRLADMLWSVALLCSETEIPLKDVAAHSIEQLRARVEGLDPDQR